MLQYINNLLSSNKNEIFYNILLFLGLRRTTNTQPIETNNLFLDLLKRNIITKQSTKTPKTPRNLTREIYKKRYNKDLSPNNSPLIEQQRSQQLNINIEKAIIQHTKKKQKKQFLLTTLSWIYTTIVFSILCISPIYTIINLSKQQSNFLYSTLFFLLIEPTQYILSLIYFSTCHFEKFFINTHNFDPQCFPNTNILCLAIILFIIILGTINFVIVIDVFKENPNIPETLTGNEPIDFVIQLLSWIYGRLTIYINLLCFSLVFCKHCKIIQSYVKKLEQENLSNTNVLSINIITQDILLIRNELEESIDRFINIFSLFTLLGAVGFGFFIERIKVGNFDLFPWNELIVYVIVQMVFIIIIYRVRSYQEDLIDYVRQPLFVEKFLKRYTVRDIQEKFDDPAMISLNLDEENSSQLDWIILDRLLNEQWAEFKVMGIDISNGELIKRGIALVSILIAINTLVTT